MWDKIRQVYMGFVTYNFAYGITISGFIPLLDGCTIITTPDFNNQTMNYYLNKNPNVLMVNPVIFEDILDLVKDSTDMSNLVLIACGGDRLAPELYERAKKFFDERGILDVQISNGYGTSEILGMISTQVGNDDSRPDTVGKVAPGVRMMVLELDSPDDVDRLNNLEGPTDISHRKEVGFNTIGYLCASARFLSPGYYHRPDLDERKYFYRDGRRYLFTGDIGLVTEDGYVKIYGRSIFFINSTTSKVYYGVVRAAFDQSDLVEYCEIVQVPDEQFGSMPFAFVTTKPGVAHDEATRQRILADIQRPYYMGKDQYVLKEYEVPRQIVFLDEMPLTKADKVDFRKLERVASKMAVDGLSLEKATNAVDAELAAEAKVKKQAVEAAS